MHGPHEKVIIVRVQFNDRCGVVVYRGQGAAPLMLVRREADATIPAVGNAGSVGTVLNQEAAVVGLGHKECDSTGHESGRAKDVNSSESGESEMEKRIWGEEGRGKWFRSRSKLALYRRTSDAPDSGEHRPPYVLVYQGLNSACAKARPFSFV